MKAHLLEQAKALPFNEQIELAEAIWGNIVEQDAVPLPTTTQQDELNRRWYEAQRKGLGKEFYAEVIRLATMAATHPTRYQLTSHDIRRVTSRRFPYSVYFRATPASVVVLAVFHARRNPSRLLP